MEISGANTFTVRSPGRINLIGEHTDYNDGYVLPAAINKYVTVTTNKRTDNRVVLFSVDFRDRYEVNIKDIAPIPGHWSNYITGIVHELQQNGYNLSGFNMVISSDIPHGAGLSSSAALCCAGVYALNAIFDLHITREQMVLIAQTIEHLFAGVQCGIMDQYASLFGKQNTAIRLDCRSRTHTYVPLDLGNYRIVLFNTNVKHSLASSAYNERRRQCEEGVRQIKKYLLEIQSLRDVPLEMLGDIDNDLIRKRCKYIIEENDRLLDGCEDLQRGDLTSFGKRMFESHRGLSLEYDVSCAELDWLVEKVRNKNGVIGARMMGGGFGGCTINLIEEQYIETVSNTLARAYQKIFNTEITTYIAETADGTCPAPTTPNNYPTQIVSV